jgi:CRP-like cAMP-binding protein
MLSAATLRTFETEEELISFGKPVRNVVFPTTVVCSLLIGLRSGKRAEMGTVGYEGYVGISDILGIGPTEHVVAQTPGDGYEVSPATMRSHFARHKNFQQSVMRFIGHAYHMARQTTACNAFHNVQQRLARWLLTVHDRAPRNEFAMTQEMLSQMVAATRPRVTEAAANLRAEGIIEYQRGRIVIRDRKNLEAKACECYEATLLPSIRLGRPSRGKRKT